MCWPTSAWIRTERSRYSQIWRGTTASPPRHSSPRTFCRLMCSRPCRHCIGRWHICADGTFSTDVVASQLLSCSAIGTFLHLAVAWCSGRCSAWCLDILKWVDDESRDSFTFRSPLVIFRYCWKLLWTSSRVPSVFILKSVNDSPSVSWLSEFYGCSKSFFI